MGANKGKQLASIASAVERMPEWEMTAPAPTTQATGHYDEMMLKTPQHMHPSNTSALGVHEYTTAGRDGAH
jgi:hypothetical protein